MDKLIVSLFGVNKFNFFGWLFTFLLLLIVATVLVVGALVPPLGVGLSPVVALLTAACVLLAGIFGVLVQLYCAMMAVRIEMSAGKKPADPE